MLLSEIGKETILKMTIIEKQTKIIQKIKKLTVKTKRKKQNSGMQAE
jgi:hypothetical protein